MPSLQQLRLLMPVGTFSLGIGWEIFTPSPRKERAIPRGLPHFVLAVASPRRRLFPVSLHFLEVMTEMSMPLV
jgi:hypothetical protein